jgi:hypothetical protein
MNKSVFQLEKQGLSHFLGVTFDDSVDGWANQFL